MCAVLCASVDSGSIATTRIESYADKVEWCSGFYSFHSLRSALHRFAVPGDQIDDMVILYTDGNEEKPYEVRECLH